MPVAAITARGFGLTVFGSCDFDTYASATSRVMCQGERGAYSLCFVFVDEDGEEDAVH